MSKRSLSLIIGGLVFVSALVFLVPIRWEGRRSRASTTPSADCVAFSHNGKWIAYISRSKDRETVFVCDGATGLLGRQLKGPHSVDEILFSADDSILIACEVNGDIRNWSTESWQVVSNIEIPKPVYSLTVLHESPVLAIGYGDAHVLLYDLHSGKMIDTLSFPVEHVTGLAASRDGTLAVAVQDDVLLYRVAEKTFTRLGKHLGEFVDRVVLSADGKILVAAGRKQNRVSCWLLDPTPKLLHDFDVPMVTSSVSLSPDGKYVLAGSYQSGWKPAHCLLYKLPSGRKLYDQTIEVEKWVAAAISPDGKQFSLGTLDSEGNVQLIQVSDQ